MQFQLERWADYRRDCGDLWAEQYEAHADQRMPLAPDDAVYAAMDAAGMMQILTARQDGVLAGHVLSILRPHMHHAQTVCGFVDTFYMSKASRRGSLGVRMIKEAIARLRDAGAMRVFFVTDTAIDTSALFRRLGFTETNAVHSLWIGG